MLSAGTRSIVTSSSRAESEIVRNGTRRYRKPERQLLEAGGQHAAQPAAELADVQGAVGVVDQGHARLAQPQRRQEGDPVDDLEDDVGIAAQARASPPRAARGNTVPRPPMRCTTRFGVTCSTARQPGIGPGDQRHPMAPFGPPGHVGVHVGAGAAALRMGPVAVGEHEDVQRPGGARTAADAPRTGRRRWAPQLSVAGAPPCMAPSMRAERYLMAPCGLYPPPGAERHDVGGDPWPAGPRRARPAAPVALLVAARPTLAAALIYAVLSVVMVGQGAAAGTDPVELRRAAQLGPLAELQAGQRARPGHQLRARPTRPTSFSRCSSTPRRSCPGSRCGTRTSWPAGRCWPTASRPCSRRSACPPTSLPFWKSLAVAAMLKLFLGAFGAFMLARVLGMRFGGALLSGVVFAFGTFFVVWLAWPLTSVYAFIPWTLALTELLVRRPGRLPGRRAGGRGRPAVPGRPSRVELSPACSPRWCSSCSGPVRSQRHRTRDGTGASLVRPVLSSCCALVAGAGLAALRAGARSWSSCCTPPTSRRRSSGVAGYWPRKYIGALFLHDYWGRPTQVDLESFMQVRGWYAGAVTLMLAATALILQAHAPSGSRWWCSAPFCACMVIGIPPVFGVVSSLPGFSAAHNERLLIYILLCLGAAGRLGPGRPQRPPPAAGARAAHGARLSAR